MNTIRHAAFSLLASFALLFAAATQAQTPAPALTEGQHYAVIPNGIPFANAKGKVEIAEVFGYWCHHCANAQPLVDKWKPRLPKDVDFVYVPAAFDMQDPFARAYFAARQLKLPSKLHQDLFRAIHVDGTLPKNASDAELAAFHTRYGVTAPKFLAAMNSKPVAAQLNWANKFAKSSEVEGTPTFIVGGKYRVLARTHQDALRIAAQLAAQLRSERR